MADTNLKLNIRLAQRTDFAQLREWDEFWGDRRQDMQRGEIYVAEFDKEECLGYMRLARNEFLNFPLVAALCTKPSARRTGVAMELLRYLEVVIPSLQVFITTEITNKEMITLLNKIGFHECGYIDHLNSDGSRELVYTKKF